MVHAYYICTQFQSTLPRGERPSMFVSSSKISAFQSTLPRGERPLWSPRFHLLFSISIHAPTRGATGRSDNLQLSKLISIHAPTRGATSDHVGCIIAVNDFNPRSHAGSDGRCYTEVGKYKYFNPRSHAGSDLVLLLPFFHLEISIHAPTRGATIPLLNSSKNIMNFNPRSHAGSDAKIIHIFLLIKYDFEQFVR